MRIRSAAAAIDRLRYTPPSTFLEMACADCDPPSPSPPPNPPPNVECVLFDALHRLAYDASSLLDKDSIDLLSDALIHAHDALDLYQEKEVEKITAIVTARGGLYA